MTLNNIAAPVTGMGSSMGSRLGFLRRNYLLLISWPIAALILAAIGWSVLLAHLNNERLRVENRAFEQAATLSRSYAANLERTVEALDQITLYVKYGWELTGGKFELADIKKKGLLPPAALLNVGISDPNGMLVTSTIPGARKVSIAHEPFFIVQKNATTDLLYIGPPAFSLLRQRYIIPFSRRLTNPNGSFGGVVVVTTEPAYFVANYDEATLGKHGFMGVVGNDDIIRVTRTGQSVYPPPPPTLLAYPELEAERGTILLDGSKWFRDKRSRYVGWDKPTEYPLCAVIGLDAQETMAPYWDYRAKAISYATLATSALAIFTVVAMALSVGLALRKYRLEAAQTTYRIATEGGNEGFYIVHPIPDTNGAVVDFEIIDSNHRGAELLRERREELIGKKVSALYEAANPERLMQLLSKAMDKGLYEEDVQVPGESSLKMRWVHLKIVRSDGELAITLRDISESKAHLAELERRSDEDVLTGLPNRSWAHRYLPRAIEHAAKGGSMLALLFVDLDGFKKVNDTAGHAAGDELLRNAARRLKEAVRPHDQVVRLGGDEFLVIVEQIEQKADAAHIAERVVLAFKESFRLPQGVRSVGTSIGISIYPSDGIDPETLLHNADIAMYSVKTSGKGSYHFYDQKFYDALRARLELEAELRQAIEQDQFLIYYQPRIDLMNGATCSMEALVRWAHPSRGLLDSLEFIPLAEESGLILGLGELVMDKVCAQLAKWARPGEKLVPVSVNISARQINEADIAAILSATLARHHIDPELVEVEVTESCMTGDSNQVSRALTAIRKMGVKLLIDDFGTGYSSLSQLQRLDFDMLKVDRAFTGELGKTDKGNVFFKAIITMAHAIEIRVVAEGVENEDQIKILKSLLCDQIQGFYISRPLPPSEMQPILPKWFFPSTT
jgi:diguanylate cyclase (GGDEF)-like protein